MNSLRRLFILPVLTLAACSGGRETQSELPVAEDSAPPAYEELLESYATPNGVRYAAWLASPEDIRKLAAVVDFYANTLPPKERQAALAWHINAYNSAILQNILKKYPTSGPLDGEPDFFERESITISGRKMSFNSLEQKVIRPTFQEPRVHFAINCASESCPPLSTKPFIAARLEADLDTLTSRFINENPHGVRTGGGIPELSPIFDWYAADFGGKDNVVAFINRYRKQPISPPVEFFDYSWKLNESR